MRGLLPSVSGPRAAVTASLATMYDGRIAMDRTTPPPLEPLQQQNRRSRLADSAHMIDFKALFDAMIGIRANDTIRIDTQTSLVDQFPKGTAVIYRAICRPTGKMYIGATADLPKRISGHRSDGKHRPKSRFHRAIQEYGWESFDWEVLDVAPSPADLQQLESRKLKLILAIGPELSLNDTSAGYCISEEARQRRSSAQRGVPRSAESRRKTAESARLSRSSLTTSDVIEIKRLLTEGELKQRQIAERFKVSRECIRDIKTGSTWSDVQAPPA